MNRKIGDGGAMRWLWKALPKKKTIRCLAPADYSAARALMARAPFDTVLMRGWLDTDIAKYGWQHFVGYFPECAASACSSSREKMTAVCWLGATIIPWGFDAEGLDALAEHIRSERIRASSFVGAANQVMPLWERVGMHMRAPQDIRPHQLSMIWRHDELLSDVSQGIPPSAVTNPYAVKPDPQVRLASAGDFDLVYPASVAMFIEEIGYDPTRNGDFYRNRVRELIDAGRTYVRIGRAYNGEPKLEFKADMGTVAGGVAQLQGVWVPPDMRGQGIASSAMLTVAAHAHKRFHAEVHLYVNDFNLPAVRAYEKAGFATIGEYATILL